VPVDLVLRFFDDASVLFPDPSAETEKERIPVSSRNKSNRLLCGYLEAPPHLIAQRDWSSELLPLILLMARSCIGYSLLPNAMFGSQHCATFYLKGRSQAMPATASVPSAPLRMPEPEIRHTTSAQRTRIIRIHAPTRERPTDRPSVVNPG